MRVLLVLAAAIANLASVPAALASPGPHLVGTTVVRAGHRVELSVTLSGDPSSCRLVASSGRAQVTLSYVQPSRAHLGFSWTVPATSRSATWRLLLGCGGSLSGQATLLVRGHSRGALMLTKRRARVQESGALLQSPSSPSAPNPPTSEAPPPASAKHCSSPSSTGTEPSPYNTTPPGPGPWQVPVDPCNTESRGGANGSFYGNCAYWAAEKRPDIWVNAVWIYGYPVAPGGAWNIELDAEKAGYPIDHNPQPGDVVAWPPNAMMGSEADGTKSIASSGGHVAFVESVDSEEGTITISEMGAGPDPTGGYTRTLIYNQQESWFIHQK
jgi:surface antigen